MKENCHCMVLFKYSIVATLRYWRDFLMISVEKDSEPFLAYEINGIPRFAWHYKQHSLKYRLHTLKFRETTVFLKFSYPTQFCNTQNNIFIYFAVLLTFYLRFTRSTDFFQSNFEIYISTPEIFIAKYLKVSIQTTCAGTNLN